MTVKQNETYLAALMDGLQEQESRSEYLQKAYQICGYDEKGQFQYLTSVLGHIGDANIHRQFDPQPLALLPEVVFPKEQCAVNIEDWEANTKAALASLAQSYRGAEQAEQYRYTLYHFMQTYGSRIAYGSGAYLDASLFDRNRVLAAVANCLEKNAGLDQFILFKGAVSGIQSYLYHDIKGEEVGEAENASKRLRGRSFLVEFFNQVLAESMVEHFDLELANILFVGGGQFVLLLPGNATIKEALHSYLKTINLDLLKNVGLQLSIVSTYVECGADLGNNFSNHYAKVSQQLDQAKLQKYNAYLSSYFEAFKGEYKGSSKHEVEQLGTLVPYEGAQHILEVRVKIGENQVLRDLARKFEKEEKPAVQSLSFLGKHFYLLKNGLKEFLQKHQAEFQDKNLHLKITALNAPEIENLVETYQDIDLPIAFGFRFFGNYAPRYTEKADEFAEQKKLFEPEARLDSVMMFEDLAKLDVAGKPEIAYKQLGVMRLDVDDLGAIFARGLGRAVPMQRLLSLSREMQLFFGGYFNKIAKAHYLYVTYSGGDDAFVVGSWLNTIHFSKSLREDFKQFSCDNPEVGFSGGIFLCNPHYPIPRFAKDAEDMEKEAKKYPREASAEDKQKNALHLFNHTLTWDRFIKMMGFSASLENAIDEKAKEHVRRSLLKRFLEMVQSSEKDKDQYTYYRNVAGLHRLLVRRGYSRSDLEEQKPGQSDDTIVVGELLRSVNSGTDEFRDFTIPFHIALYNTKKTKS